MKSATHRVSLCLAVLLLGSGCESAIAPENILTPVLSSAKDESSWSEPVWLGPDVNSTSRDWRPVLSTDGMSLFFHSDRPGTGDFDIWVSHRAGHNCPWEPAINLGAPINTTRGDGDPAFTPDGRVMFFSSNEGHGGFGRGDILMSRRVHPRDDLAWETPINLGAYVNTAAHESNPWYVASESGGTLYFDRGPGTNPQIGDIYQVEISRDGTVQGPASLVSELSHASGPHAPTVRADGRELIFWSGGAAGSRPGGVGLADLWVSTRRSVNDPWSEPENLGTPVNSPVADLSATLSHDGRTLFLTSVRPGGLGLQDLWMATRGAGNPGFPEAATQCER